MYPKKTHWTAEITPNLHGTEVVVAGWVWELRDIGRVKFVVVRDREGFVQVTLKAGKTPDHLFKVFAELSREDVVVIKGIVEASKIAKSGVEIFPSEIWILNKAKPLPIDIWSETPDLATRLKWRSVDLKRPRNLVVFTVASAMLRSIREVLYGEGFVEVFTPKIIVTSTEGGAELFPVMYFERVAYLSQSPQLYKEQLTASLERVFEIGPAYRAEKHNTDYHLNEFISVDAEAAFMDYNDIMDILEKIMRRLASTVSEYAPKLEEVGIKALMELSNIPRVDYDEAVDRLRQLGYAVNWGDDFTVEMQKALMKYYGPVYFIVNFPASLRPFYTKRKDGEKSESYDLIINGIEVASGATRIHKRDELEEEMKKRGLDPRLFESHLSVFDYGMPPHAGFGLGFNRLVTALLGLDNVRHATLYPRDRYRVEP
ncbi:aspartate--tRNA(Asn) ligase [Pyrobaculum aerophilum]|uniref:Aspartate--tRNA(Asp) ligase n=2 Tax=Pyrobaculum aerophilum TaxID=13773 RepID=SYD_PYRAE|nr:MULTISPECIES: aspartate--tRNA(Asn) ligase [Pyrobaculum]Q8ZYM8.1 RecName: Full=Aspartate--tRNA(Asp) ligase; AltName: Full=Aspartyl-tRNA synthetase; Short=AspRS; AltName: Full=Discriminating aspartyl-tRNA synthetase; Short=D-AspRS [Pyrobaculum aerophilum str. IM2]AAL62965.1 aspartyl-tRNA synthetase [Pyrobaculum aerophilum str. IM2]MCX8137695.1 aspartate--tRNA(Asn) ligase [Pyrobaculum aerophilum]HII46121.1 aspartate--tRNA(Asn) ligase [Pyrobaculum aerophilum]